ncbi:unnamed protein product [Malus baccata var. baccata]
MSEPNGGGTSHQAPANGGGGRALVPPRGGVINKIVADFIYINELSRDEYVGKNPHVNRINSIKDASFSRFSLTALPQKPVLAIGKRVRSSSPTFLGRQKSFRKEPERPMISAYSHPSRTLRSPSLSRRVRIQPHNPNINYNNSSRLLRSCLKSRETEMRIHRITSKIDEVAAGEAVADHMDSLPAEDIDNPLISLDCFIFV